MMDTKTLTRDVGSILVGEEAVKEGLIHEVGTIKEAIAKLNELIEKFKHKPKKASMARAKKKVLERMQRVERPDKEEAYVF